MATRTKTFTCDRPTPSGKCRRPVVKPGAPCGMNHAVQDVATIPVPVDAAAQADPFEGAPSGTKVNGHTASEWRRGATHWRKLADNSTQRAADATPHMPSLWPADIQSDLYSARASICDDHGTATFKGLYREHRGEYIRANARVITVAGKARWAVFPDDDIEQKRRWAKLVPVDEASDHGFEERPERAPAWARITIPNNQPNNRHEAYVVVERLDEGRPFSATKPPEGAIPN